MAFPIIAQIGMALLAKKMQDDEADKVHARNQANQLAATTQGIAERRAARAGDSGYMQAAMSGMAGAPIKPDSGSGRMLTQLGSALLAHQDAPDNDPEFGSKARVKLRRSEFY